MEREFKDKGDILWAFMGILKPQKSCFPKGFIYMGPPT